MSIHKIEPIQCGYEGCDFTCFSLTAMESHANEHYPAAAANEKAYWVRRRMADMQNALGRVPEDDNG